MPSQTVWPPTLRHLLISTRHTPPQFGFAPVGPELTGVFPEEFRHTSPALSGGQAACERFLANFIDLARR